MTARIENARLRPGFVVVEELADDRQTVRVLRRDRGVADRTIRGSLVAKGADRTRPDDVAVAIVFVRIR